MKRSPITPRRATPRRRTAPQEDADWWTWADQALRLRANGYCEHCGIPLGGRVERHHRLRKRDGGDRLANLLYLTPEHHRWVTEHPEAAREAGWIVPVGQDPSTVPVRMGLSGALWLLDDYGGRRPVP